jgi:predicted component of type VI protein secretion system
MYPAAAGLSDGGNVNGGEPRLLVERAVGHDSGIAYDLRGGATLGRGDVEIRLEDPFASSRHARISRQGHVFVIEDLGSTNGTYLNDEPLNGPQPLHPGDRIRIGDSEFSYLT